MKTQRMSSVFLPLLLIVSTFSALQLAFADGYIGNYANAPPPTPEGYDGIYANAPPPPPEGYDGIYANAPPPPPEGYDGIYANAPPPPPEGYDGIYANAPPPPAAVAGGSYGNTYANEPPPPSAVAGKEFPPQKFMCNEPNSVCYGKSITCPYQCPSFKPAYPTEKACFIDCSSPKCEAVCKNRKPDCNGMGAACYDPRFIGGDGLVFYFHGKTNEHFSLVSDSNLQINARFIGRRPEGRSRDNTWIQALGFMFNSNTFTLSANKVSQWDDQIDQLSFTYNSMPVIIDEGHLSTWAAPDSKLTVERTARTNSVTLTLPGVVEISVSVVPITKEDDRIHNYQIPSDDCFAHLEVQFKFFDLSEAVEGVLGQTYRPEFQNPVKRGVAMPIMGGEHKYRTSSLLSSDCRSCIFSSEAVTGANSLVLDSSATVDCTSKMSNGRGIVCRR